MAKVNLSQAAKLAGKNRTTIWRHINSGKLSIERDRDGLPLVETSELIRVYGELQPVATPKSEKVRQEATPSYDDLLSAVERLLEGQLEMKKQIADLKNRLNFTPEKTEPKRARPEDDPDWPEKIESLSDVSLRNEIKSRYDALDL